MYGYGHLHCHLAGKPWKFIQDIAFREGEPVQLLQYADEGEGFGKIVLNPEALDILQAIREQLAIISVGK